MNASGASFSQSQSDTWYTPQTQYDGRTEQAVIKARQKAATKHASGVYAKGTGAPTMNDLQRQASMWGTPTARDWKDGAADLTNVPEKGLLGRMAANWSTPRAMDAEKGGPNQNFGAGGIPLPAQAQQWPTPTSMLSVDNTDPEKFKARQERLKERHKGRTGNGAGPDLAMAAKTWPYGESHQPGNSKSYNETMRLAEPLSLRSVLPDRPISTVGEESSALRRSLNPLFVEWLMGWPRGWTLLALTPPGSNDFANSATALSLWKQRMRSELLHLGLPPEASPAQQSLFA